MTLRKRILFAALSVTATAVGLALVIPRFGASPPPEDFEAFAAQCATFHKAEFFIRNRGHEHKKPYSGIFKKGVVHLHEDGRWSVDDMVFTGRLAWADGLLTYENLTMSTPKPIDGFGTTVEDVWAECRNGFEDTDWVEVARPEGAHNSPSLVWARLDFPFDWADLVDVYLGVEPNHDTLAEIVLYHRDTWRSVDIDIVDFRATFAEQALSRDAPYRPPPQPRIWGGY